MKVTMTPTNTEPVPRAGTAPHVLLVEDNPDILANLYAFLEPLGYTLDSARSGPAALALAFAHVHDVVVLDLMLPGMDGLDVCRRLRSGLRARTPVLMLTARDGLQDKVAGFEAGADDYLVKPFSMVELDLRLRALLRRVPQQNSATVLTAGELRLDLGQFEAWRGGVPLRLTPTGVKLLAALMRAAPQVVTRAQLEREIWGDNPPNSDALRTHLHALRTVVDKQFTRPLLRTLPGFGYCLDISDAP